MDADGRMATDGWKLRLKLTVLSAFQKTVQTYGSKNVFVPLQVMSAFYAYRIKRGYDSKNFFYKLYPRFSPKGTICVPFSVENGKPESTFLSKQSLRLSRSALTIITPTSEIIYFQTFAVIYIYIYPHFYYVISHSRKSLFHCSKHQP